MSGRRGHRPLSRQVRYGLNRLSELIPLVLH